MHHRSVRTLSVFLLASLAAVAACSSDSTKSAASTTTRAPANDSFFSHPSWASAEHLEGQVDTTKKLSIQLHLKLRDEAAADAELADISDPSSANYRKFLTKAEFASKYAPTEADVATVRSHLEQNGLTVSYVAGDRTILRAEGTASAVERAFSTRLGQFRVGTELRHAPLAAPVLPGAVSSRVSAVFGLASAAPMKPKMVHVGGIHRSTLAKKPKTGPGPAGPGSTCSEWFGQSPAAMDPPFAGTDSSSALSLSFAPCGYAPPALREAYGLSAAVRAGHDGRGSTIAIIDAFQSPTLLADAQTYAAQNDAEFPLKTEQFTAVTAPGTPGPVDTGWYGEQTLDVEAAHAMAPGANLLYVGAADATDEALIAAIHVVVDGQLATIVSNSYGSTESSPSNFVAWKALATQAGLFGIGLYFASGDAGDESASSPNGAPTTDFPAVLPNVTSVGGTSLAIGQTGDRVFESGWETGISRLQAPDDGSGDPIIIINSNGSQTAKDDDAGAGNGGGNNGGGNNGGGNADGGAPAPPAMQWTPAFPGAFQFGGGGGVSQIYDQPSYQRSVVPATLSNILGTQARVVPDVAMLADPVTGFVVGQTDPLANAYGESVVGGTSLACPLFAGVMAVAESRAGHSFGFANPALYRANARGAFVDIAPLAASQAVAVDAQTIATFDFNGLTIHTAEGFDNVTGLGTPNGAQFLRALR